MKLGYSIDPALKKELKRKKRKRKRAKRFWKTFRKMFMPSLKTPLYKKGPKIVWVKNKPKLPNSPVINQIRQSIGVLLFIVIVIRKIRRLF